MIRSPQSILIRSPGQRVNGVWQNGAETPGTIIASVQPATASDNDQMQNLLGGKRIERAVRIYTAERLNVAGENRSNGDVLLWQGARYIVSAVGQWRTTPLRHYRYIAIKELES
jgi:hypothetical protein